MKLNFKDQHLIFASILGQDFEIGVQVISPDIFGEDSHRPCFTVFINDEDDGTQSLSYYNFKTQQGGNWWSLIVTYLSYHSESNDSRSVIRFKDRLLKNPLSIKQPKSISYVKRKKKKPPKFKIRKRFNNSEIQYWQQFGVSTQNLKDNLISSLKWVKFPKFTIESEPDNPIFLYRFHGNKEAFQIYRPLGGKFMKFYFFSIQGLIDGLPRHQNTKELVLNVSSRKDRMVIENLGYKAINCLGEGSIRPYKMNQLPPNLLSLYDPDIAGCFASTEKSKAKGSHKLFLECGIPYVDTKDFMDVDFAEYRKLYGQNKLEKLLKKMLKPYKEFL